MVGPGASPRRRRAADRGDVVMLVLCSLLFACSGVENNGAIVDGGDAGATDANEVRPPPRDKISQTTWESLKNLSPVGGIAPPTDPTNRFAHDERAVRLGQFLFFEPAISGDGTVSCASCHQPDKGFADGTPLPTNGIRGEEERPLRHTPSLVNIAYSKWYFWDGRVDTLWGQAIIPYENPIEMGGSRLQLAHYVYDTPEVKAAYEDLFGDLPARSSISPFPARGRPVEDPATPEDVAHDEAWQSMREADRDKINLILANIAKAIAAYEMQLVSVEAPFDRFVEQIRQSPDDPEEWDAISVEAQEGMRLFIDVVGCLECHKGPHFLDNKFHNLGLPSVDWADSMDPGRQAGLPLAKNFEFSSAGEFSDDPDGPQAQFLRSFPGDFDDLGAFRTTTLRNIGAHPPYMHGGHFETLEDVMDFYNEPPDGFPLVGARSAEIDPMRLEQDKVDALVAFLKTLDGEPVAAEYRTQPESPRLP